MNRNQISFGIAGLVFGILIGFVTAHEIYVGRHPAPRRAEAPPPASAPTGPAQAGPAGQDMATMEQVRAEIGRLKSTLEKYPENVTALARLGDLYMDAGMCDQAVEYFTTALRVDETLVDVRTDMGTCLRRMGKPDEALKEFQTSVSYDPQHWRSWFNIGILSLYDLGKYDDARSAFEKVLELNPNSIDMDAVQAEIEKVRAQHEKSAGKGSAS
ncbi:MAG: tetratricopeptide repeat protein [Acidobacteriota bacterium]